MSTPRIPIFITAQQIADAIDWRRQRVIRVMRKMGIARKRGKEIVVNAADFAGIWPDEFEVILEKLADVPAPKHGHTGIKRRTKPTKLESVSKQTRVKIDTNACAHVWQAHLPGTVLTCKLCGKIDTTSLPCIHVWDTVGVCEACGAQRSNN